MSKKKKIVERLAKSFGMVRDKDYYFELIEKYFRNKDNTDSFQVLSDKTCNDLDFEELFMFLDRTNSKVGQQYLYHKLRNIPTDSAGLELREKIIKKLTEETEFRINIQRQLEQLNKDDAYYIASLFQEELKKPPKWFFVIRILAFTSLLSIVLLPFNPQMIFVLIGIFIINLGIHYWNKRNLYEYVGSIPNLLRLNGLALKLYKESIFYELNPKLKESINIINQVRNRMSFFQLETKFQSNFEVAFWLLLELFKTLFLLEPLLLFGVLKRLDTKREQIEDVFCFVGEIDSLLSIASLRYGLGKFCLPTISETNISVTG
ncbi:MAG: DNA mismatch repair protein MutS, partial [Bacteroidetes bacterium]